MKRTAISQMTAEQAADELVFHEFEKMIRNAKRKAKTAHEAEESVFSALEDMCIDAAHTKASASNADSIADAIGRFLRDGEGSVKNIMQDVRAAYGAQEGDAR